MTRNHICIATLGGQPQVVTLALDRLLARYPIRELLVVHLATHTPRYRFALECLAQEFVHGQYVGQACRFQPFPVRDGGLPVDDIMSDLAADAAMNTFTSLIQDLKREDAVIHLCLSGGRRLLGVLAMSVALLYFDQSDRVWHLYSPESVRRQTAGGAALHSDHPDIQLIPVPIHPWGHLFPALRPQPSDATAGWRARTRQLDDTERSLCQQVYRELTRREREVLRAIAEDHDLQEVATLLNIQLSTVYDHKNAIAQKCCVAWGLPLEQRLNHEWLRKKFAPFFATL